MNFNCQDALPLVDSYLDGELTEVRASLLRKHLLDCSACRTGAQDSKALSRWFAKPKELEFAPPAGFSARVARRAFAGDVGRPDGFTVGSAEANHEERGRLLQFVLTITAAAAAIMLVSAVALRDQRLPNADRLDAANPPATAEQVLLQLDKLNLSEGKALTPGAPASELPANAAGRKP